VQDSSQKHTTLGEYSVSRNDWNKFPNMQRANFNDSATKMKYDKLKELSIMALASIVCLP